MTLAAIILAAGAGRRFGGGKLLSSYHGRPLIHHALHAADSAPVDDIIVVVGAEADRVTGTVFDCPMSHPVRTVIAADWQDGMSASLRAGCAALAPDVAGAFIFLGDMPAIPTGIFAPLVAALEQGAPAAAPLCDGIQGHPVLLGRILLDRIQDIRGDVGARALLASAILIPAADRGVLLDIDQPGDG